MNIPKRLLKCVDKESKENSPLQHVYVDVADKQAWATNGRLVVCIPIAPEDGECSGLVPAAAIEAAEKQPKNLRGRLMHGENVTSIFGGATWDNPTADTEFPLTYLQQLYHNTHGQRVMHIDLALLRLVCDALSDTRVRIYHNPVNTEQLLYLENDKGERVVVCPLSSNAQGRMRRMSQHCAEEGLSF